MRFTRIENDQVVNVEDWAVQPVVAGVVYVRSDAGDIGWSYDASTGTINPPRDGPSPLAESLPAWKVKYVLAGASGSPGNTLLDDATAALTALGDQQAQIKFQAFPDWFLNDPLLMQMKAALGLSDDQFASYWREAMAL